MGEKSLPLNVRLGRGKNNSRIAKERNIVFKVFKEQIAEDKFKDTLTFKKLGNLNAANYKQQ